MALTTPFAQNGNKTTIPQTTSDGSVSYDQGFGSFYALPPEEGGLFIDRAQFNQLMYDTTSQVIANTNAITTKANANATVNLTGTQTIQGVKTFSAPPVSATNPTANNQIANKAYVDTVGNTAVKLTGAQSIAGAKTFTSNITAPNIATMQNSINTINGKIANLEQGEALELTVGNTASGASFQTLDEALAEAAKYFGNKLVEIVLLSDITINKTYHISGDLCSFVNITSSDGAKHTITFDAGGQLNFWSIRFGLSKIDFRTTQPNITFIRALSGSLGYIGYSSFDGAAISIVNRTSFLNIEYCEFANISERSLWNYRGGISDLSFSTINENVARLCWQREGGIVSVDDTTINSQFTTSKYNITANTLTADGIIFDND